MSVEEQADSKRAQLTRQDWVNAAISVMVASSIDQVRVEKLATQLGLSKGSFYWHFRDRPDLLSAILDDWRDKATLSVNTRIQQADLTTEQKLLMFLQLPIISEAAIRAADLELAIYDWARRSPDVEAAVQQVDQLRTSHLLALLEQMGFPPEEALFRAHKGYAVIRYIAQRRDIPIPERRQMAIRMHAEISRKDDIA